jgi:uncharacterized membrane protein YdfJ with MMPL/SSD domain
VRVRHYQDGIVIPLALAILGYMVQSWRVLAIPLVSVAVSLGCSFGAMSLIALAVDVNSATPNLMLTLALATSFDYSLFLLVRWREEHRAAAVRQQQEEVQSAACLPAAAAAAGSRPCSPPPPRQQIPNTL